MPDPIPSAVQHGLFDYQFHQVAIFCPKGVQDAVEHWERLGYDNWIVDSAVLSGKIKAFNDPTYTESRVKATMAFNYDIMPMELEFLHYGEGDHRHSHTQIAGREHEPFISHMSTYVDDVIWHTQVLVDKLGELPFHRFITTEHSNPAVKGKKRFIESIFDTKSILGYDTKLIQKVAWDYPDEAWLGQEFS